VRPADLC